MTAAEAIFLLLGFLAGRIRYGNSRRAPDS